MTPGLQYGPQTRAQIQNRKTKENVIKNSYQELQCNSFYITMQTFLAFVDSMLVLYWGTKRGSKFNLKIYKKHVSNIFFENYITTVCEITLQRSSDSVDSKL